MLENLASLKGLVSHEEGLELHGLAKRSLPGFIVEIGSHRGKSTCYLAQGSIDGAAERGIDYLNTVYAIDLWTKGTNPHWNKVEIFRDFVKQTQPYEPILHSVMDESTRVAKTWSGDISLLFIDANHTYRGARNDLMAWCKFLKVGGFLVFDDVNKETVQRAMKLIDEMPWGFDSWTTVGKIAWTERFR